MKGGRKIRDSLPLGELNHPVRRVQPIKQAFPHSHHRIARAGRMAAMKQEMGSTEAGNR